MLPLWLLVLSLERPNLSKLEDQKMAFLETAATVMQLANSAKSLFGMGNDDGGMSSKDFEKQIKYQGIQALEYPTHQVQGLRNAGLNPMLAVGKGISAPPTLNSEPGLETKLATAKQVASSQSAVAAATIQNLAASSAKMQAEAKLTEAQTRTEENRPGNIIAQTGAYGAQTAHQSAQAALADTQRELAGQQFKTEGYKTEIARLDEAFSKENYGNRVNLAKVELDKARAELSSARTKADVDKALLRYERIAAMAKDASGAVSGLIPWNRLFQSSAKAIRKPK